MFSLSSYFQQVGLRLFSDAVSAGVVAGRSDAKLAWEVTYFAEILGLGEYKPHPDFDPPRPWPIGPWAAQDEPHMSPQLAIELIRVSARTSVVGDPDPQPNKLSLLVDRKLQLEAALSVRDKLKDSLKSIDEIIDGLER